MAIQLSPSVVVQERDLTNVIPAVSTSVGATIVDAGWGPVMEVTRVDSENELVAKFGKPNATNATSWFTAANFLAYSNNLLVVRTDTAGQKNAVATATASVGSFTITNGGSGYASTDTVFISAPAAAGGVQATGVATIVGGVVTAVEITNPGSGYTSTPTISITTSAGVGFTTSTVQTTTAGVKINNETDYLNSYSAGQGIVGEFAAKYPGTAGNSLTVSMADAASFATWAYKGAFDGAPSTSSFVSAAGGSGDELHIVVVDKDGKWTGTAGTVMESFAYVSKAGDAKKEDGSTAYYKNVINTQSSYVYWMDHPTAGTNWGSDASVAGTGTAFASIGATAVNRPLTGGTDQFTSTDGRKMDAFALFNNDEQYDISLIMCGKANTTVANYVIQNVAEVRKDCVAFVSPQDATTGDVLSGNSSAIATKLIAFRTALSTSSSYAFIDSGYKYQYDRYNDQYRWVPLNGDVAGLCARTDYTNDSWFSPAGLNRGQIKNVVRLAYSPTKTNRDELYKAGINPVVSFPGQGIVLYGDKTALTKPSAFDRINVRRLFITLEKAIATAAKYQLFEFNDGFTRAQFRNMVEPFLRDVKGRRGLTDFLVVCDETNNTAEVIDTNRFVADIYLKPARSINFIQLNFVATRTGASFSEIAGA